MFQDFDFNSQSNNQCMEQISELLNNLHDLDVKIWADGNTLRYNAPPEILTPALLDRLRSSKTAILKFLHKSQLPPILPVNRDRDLPLSFAQQRLWFLEQLDPNRATYCIATGYRLTGALDVTALEQSLDELVRRHEILRTTFPDVNGLPSQFISPATVLILPSIDLSELSSSQREAEALHQAQQEAQRPFDLAQGPLFRAKLLRLTAQEHILLLNMHHIISDGWSFDVSFRELTTLYQAFANHWPTQLPQLPIQYADFALWQREWIQAEFIQSQLDYWKQQFSQELAVLQIPTDRPRPRIKTYQGSYQSLEISSDLTTALKALSQQEGVTLFMTLLAAFQTLLFRYCAQTDIIVGSPISGRNQAEINGLIGFFVNTLVLRTDLSGNPSFRELLSRVREVALGAYAHQDLPFEHLLEELQPNRDLSRTPLFDVMFVLQKASSTELKLPGLALMPLEVDNGTAKFDLTLELQESGTSIKGRFEYNTDLFDAGTIARMIDCFQTLLASIVRDPQQLLSSLSLLSASQQHQLLVEWNDTKTEYPDDKCIHQLFEEQVERSPNAVAIVFEGRELTYQQLNHRANQLAHHLQTLGIKPEVLVGICVERSLEMVVGLLAILKAGGAYVPLNPADPNERLTFMLEDTQVPVILTQQTLVDCLPAHQAHVICLDTYWQTQSSQSEKNLTHTTTADNLAYIIYTSGSTGKPKGCCTIHRGVVRLVKGIDYARINSAETFLQLAPVSFDASTFEIWGSLLHGARLIIFPSHSPSLTELGQAIRRDRITTLWLTAGLFHLMVDEGMENLKSLRQLLVGGDVLSVTHVQKFLQELEDCQLIDGYGPTENTTFTCCYHIAKSNQLSHSVPIGRPIANTQVYILDTQLNPVPIGVPGELYIGGDGLARGYLNSAELTAAKFIPNPFQQSKQAQADRPTNLATLYKTGDLACYLPDSNIKFLGRIDNQVKIRGFRIELGEIETVLLQHLQVKEVLVIAREDPPGNKRLIAYVVCKQEQVIASDDLRCFLMEKLPDYMVPSVFVCLDALPLNSNGKVDRRALPAPDSSSIGKNLKATFVAPRDELEVKLTKIWAEVLGIQEIGIQHNFFDLGGHSLLAVKLLNQIERNFQIDKLLPLAAVFQAPTIEQLAALIRQEGWEACWRSLVPLQPIGAKPPLFLVHACNGEISIYRLLALHLGLDRPVYGLQAQGLDGKQLPDDRVEAMATHYIKEIQSIQPTGPYFLGGKQVGALVAFEIAQQLVSQGQQVELVVSLGFDFNLRKPQIRRFHKEWIARQLTLISQLGPNYILDRITEIGHWQITILKQILTKFSALINGNLSPHNNQLVAAAISQAVANYVPQTYSGRVAIFKPMESYQGYNDGCQELDRLDLIACHELFAGGFELHYVPGTEAVTYTAYKEPYVSTLAEKLKICLAGNHSLPETISLNSFDI